MKRIILSLLTIFVACATIQAQRLVSVKNYGANWQRNMLTMKNKPNGTIYRLREEKQNEYLPRGEEAKDLEQFISERIDIGWLALYRRSAGDDNYKFIVKIYDRDENLLYTIDLGQVSGNNYCEVQDVRWDNDTHNLLFNMACPSYASGVNGKGSKLHCYNPERREMVWSTDWLTSNDIFILDSKFVFCSYGFTSEKKFLFMLDKFTGKVYSKLPFTYKVEYLELKTEGSREYLYAIDYNDNLFKYYVEGAKTVAENGKVFTVVFAASDDGYLNVRSQPSMNGKIIGKLTEADHDLGRGILIEKGKQWSKIAVDEVEGWVYTKYLGQMTWMAGNGPKLIAKKDPTAIWVGNNVDGGLNVFCAVDKGTIIADIFFEHGDYYELRTGHDNLFVKKSDVIIK